jgi:(p)ppGpp synthase/HD superfamily hydrolase
VQELTERFADASKWAAELHRDHFRKGTGVPYVSHLFAVASLVLEDGGSEDEAIGALLHDSVEDAKTTFDAIRDRFGADVADIVRSCSDAEGSPKPPWRERKAKYVAHLRTPTTPQGALRVSNADKLHNARSLLADYADVGDALWQRFNVDARSAEAQLWYYGELVDAFLELRPESRLATELSDTVDALRASVAAS